LSRPKRAWIYRKLIGNQIESAMIFAQTRLRKACGELMDHERANGWLEGFEEPGMEAAFLENNPAIELCDFNEFLHLSA
jgi:hypothetical protein